MEKLTNLALPKLTSNVLYLKRLDLNMPNV